MPCDIKNIVALLEDMRPTLERCGISEKFIIYANCDKLPGYCLEDAEKWLTDLKNGEFKEAQRIRNMLSEAMWARYELWEEFADHRECILYTERLAKFKAACRGKPLIFRHGACEIAATENSNKKPKNKKKVKNEDRT